MRFEGRATGKTHKYYQGEFKMTVISMRQITPKIGKTELVTNRVRSMACIVARAGARVRIGNVVCGEGVDSLHMYAA